MTVRFACEWRDAQDDNGLMRPRIASINDAPIDASERRFLWPLGPRLAQHPSLDELGF